MNGENRQLKIVVLNEYLHKYMHCRAGEVYVVNTVSKYEYAPTRDDRYYFEGTEGHIYVMKEHCRLYGVDNTTITTNKDDKVMYFTKRAASYLYNEAGILPTVNTTSLIVTNNMSSKPTSEVDMSEFGVFTVDGKAVRLGRLLKAIKSEIKDTEIEAIVSKHKQLYTIDTSKVLVSEDIRGIYDMSQVGGSCMAYKGDFMDIYEDLGCKIAYIEVTDSNNKDRKILGARALLWDNLDCIDTDGNTTNINMMDRIFFSKEIHNLTLLKWAEENGYIHVKKFNDEVLVTKGKVDHYERVPYVDTMYYVTDDRRLCNCSEYGVYDELRNTDGSSSNRNIAYGHGEEDVWCSDVDEYHHIDECYFVENFEEYWYYDDDLVYIYSCGYYHKDCEYICYAEDKGEYMLMDDCVYIDSEDMWLYDTSDYAVCFYSGEWYHIDNLIFCTDIDEYVNTDYEFYYYVVDLDEYYYYNDKLHEHSDGQWYSEPEEVKEDESK